jgi:hypothetical protein
VSTVPLPAVPAAKCLSVAAPAPWVLRWDHMKMPLAGVTWISEQTDGLLSGDLHSMPDSGRLEG